MALPPRPARSGPKHRSPPWLLSAPTATPPLAANKALATRENQGNLAPVNNGGRFLSVGIFQIASRCFRSLSNWVSPIKIDISMNPPNQIPVVEGVPDTILDGSRFLRACLRRPVDRTPVWFLRQAGRYMQEYRDIRKHHTLVEICKQPDIAAEVTITAAEKLGVDAAIIFADLLLPLEPMGLPFEFQAGEGPVVRHPVRTAEDVRTLRTDRAEDLAYVARAIQKVATYFRDRLGIIGFCGAPFTLASYMIEGGGSRNYIHTKQMMYRDDLSWRLLLDKLVTVLTDYCRMQVQAGADVIQIFDSWAGSLGLSDYCDYAFEASKRLVRAVQQMGVPVIYFGVETAGLLEQMAGTGADVIGLDWRQPLDA